MPLADESAIVASEFINIQRKVFQFDEAGSPSLGIVDFLQWFGGSHRPFSAPAADTWPRLTYYHGLRISTRTICPVVRQVTSEIISAALQPPNPEAVFTMLWTEALWVEVLTLTATARPALEIGVRESSGGGWPRCRQWSQSGRKPQRVAEVAFQTEQRSCRQSCHPIAFDSISSL